MDARGRVRRGQHGSPADALRRLRRRPVKAANTSADRVGTAPPGLRSGRFAPLSARTSEEGPAGHDAGMVPMQNCARPTIWAGISLLFLSMVHPRSVTTAR